MLIQNNLDVSMILLTWVVRRMLEWEKYEKSAVIDCVRGRLLEFDWLANRIWILV